MESKPILSIDVFGLAENCSQLLDNKHPANFQLVHVISSDADDSVSSSASSEDFRGFASPPRYKPEISSYIGVHFNAPAFLDIPLQRKRSYSSEDESVHCSSSLILKRFEGDANQCEGIPSTVVVQEPHNLPTAIDQVVEINSNSTTYSQRQRRLQRCSARRLYKNPKMSRESITEFPISSPSNRRKPLERLLHQRSSARKGMTIVPLERQLAMIKSRNPQMTIEEKIQAWKCDSNPCDVDDVSAFDENFQRYEAEKRKSHRKIKFQGAYRDEIEKNYDFFHFCNVILKNVKVNNMAMDNQRCNTIPTLPLSLRHQGESGGEPVDRRRPPNKKNSISTTPPPKSLSTSKASTPMLKHQCLTDYVPIKEKMRKPSSSECSAARKRMGKELKGQTKEDPLNVSDSHKTLIKVVQGDSQKSTPANSPTCKTTLKSPVIDQPGKIDCDEPKGLIKMRYDFLCEKNSLNLKQRKNDIFKMPSPKKVAQYPRFSLKMPANSLNVASFAATSVKSPCSSKHSQLSQNDFDTMSAPLLATHASGHKQYEFCSYLGLTGMSTANAMANAVAELARSTVTRRSLRVHRQQNKNKTLSNNIHKKKTRTSASLYRMMPKDCSEKTMAERGELLLKHLKSNVPHPILGHKFNEKSEVHLLSELKSEITAEAEKLSKKMSKNTADPVRRNPRREVKKNSSYDGPQLVKKSPQVKKSSYHVGTVTDSSVLQKSKEEVTTSSFDKKTHVLSALSNTTHILDVENTSKSSECLHTKFQEYLDASRQKKPSIFIVQSIDSEKDKKVALPKVDNIAIKRKFPVEKKVSAKPAKVQKAQKATESRKPAQSIAKSKNKTKVKLRRLLTRSVLNLSHQRQLRNRKIFVLKTIKRKTTNKIKETKLTKEDGRKFGGAEMRSIHGEEIMLKDCILKRCEMQSVSAVVEGNDNHEDNLITEENIERTTLPSLNKTADDDHPVLNACYDDSIEPSQCDLKAMDNDVVVVSSTTNYLDETKESAIQCETGAHACTLKHNSVHTKDSTTQCIPNNIHHLTAPSSHLKNPLNSYSGEVLFIYYEMETLIVIQELAITFWKYSKLVGVLNTKVQQHLKQQKRVGKMETFNSEDLNEWLLLGESKRLLEDVEVESPYSNRLLINGSTPIYTEMRSKKLPKDRRACNLLSMYVNIYYYSEESYSAKTHSIQLDSVQSLVTNVIYTTITDSRYFVMSWPQENVLGKRRSGLCKYSLTPHLDTLASIREFKSLRHEIRHLDCVSDDKLIGFGATQLTLWDHRSGDVLMNYDLHMELGCNLGFIYYPSVEVGQSSVILIFQYILSSTEEADVQTINPEVLVLASNISHTAPSYRVLYRHALPPTFMHLSKAMNNGEHILLTAANQEEIWISCNDPKMLTFVPAQSSKRFYTRGRSQLVELTDATLSVDSFTNHILKIAALMPL